MEESKGPPRAGPSRFHTNRAHGDRPHPGSVPGKLFDVGWDDDEDDDWPERETDPEVIARKRANAAVVATAANRALRIVYGFLGLLLIFVIVLAIVFL